MTGQETPDSPWGLPFSPSAELRQKYRYALAFWDELF